MDAAGAALVGLFLAGTVAYATTPLAIRVACRYEFYDRPGDYKGHLGATPYLGGAAVMLAFAVACLLLAGEPNKTLPIVSGAVLMWIVGTIDDRRTVDWRLRVLLEASLAAGLHALGLGWDLGAGPALDLVVTIAWVIAVVNALNLFDNMDGQASTMAFVIAGAISALGAIEGDLWLGVCAAALCGACLGFLPHNLARPARIFLGDGGSMPIGFALAGLVMAGANNVAPAGQALAIGLLLVGVPALDTTLVTISRRRRGLSLLTGGRDHLTHRTRQRLRTAQAVAVALGSAQAMLAALALWASREGALAIVVAVALFLAIAGVTLARLEAPHLRADERDLLAEEESAARADETPTTRDAAPASGSRRPSAARWVVLVALGLLAGLSPLWHGFYSSSQWAPGGLLAAVLFAAAVIARPHTLERRHLAVLGAFGGLALWTFATAIWADSIAEAVIAANRYALYTLLLALLLVLVRTRVEAMWLIGAFAVGAWTLAGITYADMLLGTAGERFDIGRLSGPLDYVNGQAAFTAMALWPALALAERRRPLLAGAGAALAMALAVLLLLSVSRGVALGTVAAIVLIVGVLPGRVRRLWLVVALSIGTALVAGPALDVSEGISGAEPVDADLLQHVARLGLAVAAAVGVAWAIATAVAELRLARRLRRPAIGLLVAGGIAVVGVAAVNAGTVASQVERQYNAFVNLGGTTSSEPSSSRLVSGGGHRYDYWRIALNVWKDHPAGGVGGGGYVGPYLLQRKTVEDVRQPHSLPLQVASETGTVGLILLGLLAFVLIRAVPGVARSARNGGSADRMVALAALGIVAVFAVQTSVDWLHLFPGLTAIALIAIAAILRSGPLQPLARTGPLVAVLAAVVLTLAGISFARQSLAEHFRAEAQSALRTDARRGLEQINRSLKLDRESTASWQTRAAALARFNDPEGARQALLEAVDREPDAFLSYALLGDLAARTGDLEEARRRYRQALDRNPRAPALLELVHDPEAALR